MKQTKGLLARPISASLKHQQLSEGFELFYKTFGRSSVDIGLKNLNINKPSITECNTFRNRPSTTAKQSSVKLVVKIPKRSNRTKESKQNIEIDSISQPRQSIYNSIPNTPSQGSRRVSIASPYCKSPKIPPLLNTLSKIKAAAVHARRSRFNTDARRAHFRTSSDIEKILQEYESSERVETARYLDPVKLNPKVVYSGCKTPKLNSGNYRKKATKKHLKQKVL